MTRTSPSTAAGSDGPPTGPGAPRQGSDGPPTGPGGPRRVADATRGHHGGDGPHPPDGRRAVAPEQAPRRDAHLRTWLRRARACPEAGRLVLRGSLLLDALCPGARAPNDVDYLAPGPVDFARCERLAGAVAASPDPHGGPPLAVTGCAVIFAETASPGVRAFVTGDGDAFHVDFAWGDPLPEPPRPIEVAGVGSVLACTAETLFGWKLHGLVEYGRGRWRPKDLFDLWLLRARLPLDARRLRAAVELAFASRDLPLGALDDFRGRSTWGESRNGRRAWRAFERRTPGAPDFAVARDGVRALVDDVLG